VNPPPPQTPTWQDVFLSVAGRRSITAEALTRSLWSEAGTVQAHLDHLVSEGLLICQGADYQRGPSPRADLLFGALTFAMAYEYDYNAYMSDEMVDFIRQTYDLDYFTADDVRPAGLTRPILGRLLEDGLVLAFRYEPFAGRMVKNPFLDQTCQFLNVRPVRKLFGRKMRLDAVIGEKMLALHRKDMEQVSRANRLLFPAGQPPPTYRPSQVQRIIRYDLVPENQDLFDPEVGRRFALTMETMRQNVQARRPLDVERIREYHGLLMQGSEFAGVLRSSAVQVTNNPYFRTAAPKTIPDQLEKMSAEYARRSPTVSNLPEVLALAAFLYNEFLYIHPFEDGNSRTARILLAHVLCQHRAGFEEIPKSFDVRFLQVTKGARKRDDRELLELLKEILLAHLNQDELKRARELG